MPSYGGTVKLSGEGEYKNALRDIQANLKSLGAEMKATTSLYDTNDKSTEKLTAQNNTLKKSIEEQEKKVSILADALAKSQKETGDSSDTTKKWQLQLDAAQAELKSLNKQVENNNSTIAENEKNTGKADKELKRFGDTAEKTGEQSLKLGDIIKANLISDAIKSGISALAEGIKSAASAMTEAISSATTYADDIITLSKQTSISTDELQRYSAVAELTDVSVETLAKSMAKNTKSMASAKDTYKELGIAITDSNGELKKSEDVYWETIDALGKIENETERDAMSMELFGKSATELNPIIEMGSEAVKELGDTMDTMGTTVSENSLVALGDLDDQIQIFKASSEGAGRSLAASFAPALTDIMSSVNSLTGSFNGLVGAIVSGSEEGIETYSAEIKNSIGDIMSEVNEFAPMVIEIVGTLLTSICTVIIDNLPNIVQGGCDIITSMVQGISGEGGTSIAPTILECVNIMLNTIITNLPTILNTGIKILGELVSGIGKALPDLIPAAIDCILTVVDTLLDPENINMIVDAGIDILFGLCDGILNALPQLIDRIPQIIISVTDTLANNLPKLVEAGIKITVQLGVGIIKAIPQLISKIPELTKSLFNSFSTYYDKMLDIGKNLVTGLWDGIQQLASWLWDKVSGWISGIWDGICDFFDIHSPSRKTGWVGEMLVSGLGNSIKDNGKEAVEAAEDMSADIMDAFGEMNADLSLNTLPSEVKSSKIIDIGATSGTSASYSMVDYGTLVKAFNECMKNATVQMDGQKMGKFVVKTVEREVYA